MLFPVLHQSTDVLSVFSLYISPVLLAIPFSLTVNVKLHFSEGGGSFLVFREVDTSSFLGQLCYGFKFQGYHVACNSYFVPLYYLTYQKSDFSQIAFSGSLHCN